ncbi:MAG: hypothetical protein LH702_24860, partial [Phormidesmis sp. CAN_BIN44]|nr:hypothetical protein [Phormidesmis sp. CAN_BIN44]
VAGGESGAMPLGAMSGLAQDVGRNARKVEADYLLEKGLEKFHLSQFRKALQSWEQALSVYREIGYRQVKLNNQIFFHTYLKYC